MALAVADIKMKNASLLGLGPVIDKITGFNTKVEEQAKKIIAARDATKELSEKTGVYNDALYKVNQYGPEAAQAIFGISEETDKNNDLISIAIEKHKQFTEQQKALNDAGIVTTASIRSQIDSLESLFPAVENDNYAYNQLYSMIHDLYVEIGDTKGLKEFREKCGNVTNTFIPLNVQGRELANNIDKVRRSQVDNHPVLETSTKKAKDLKEETEETTISFKDFASYANKVAEKLPGLDNSVKTVTSAISSLATKGFSPLNIATTAASVAFGLFGDKKEKVVVTVDQIIERMGALGVEITKTKDFIEELSDSFQSNALASYTKHLDALLERKAKLTSDYENTDDGDKKEKINEAVHSINETINTVIKEINRLVEALVFDVDFTETLDGLKYLTTEAVRMFSYYGDTLKGTGIVDLLEEQIKKSAELREGLDKDSKAYADVETQIMAAAQAMINLGALQNEVAALLARFDMSLVDFAGGIKDKFGDIFDNSSVFDALQNQMQGFFNSLLDAEQNMDTEAYEEMSKNIYAVAQKMKDMGISGEELNAKLERVGLSYTELAEKFNLSSEEINEAAGIVGALSTEMADLGEELKTIDPDSAAYDEQVEKIVAVAQAMLEMGASNAEVNAALAATGLTLEQVTGKVAGLEDAWRTATSVMTGEWSTFEDEVAGANKTIDDLMFFNVDLDTTDADESLLALIESWDEYLAKLDPNSEAYQQAAEMVNGLKQRYNDLTGATLETTEAAVTMADAFQFDTDFSSQKDELDTIIEKALAIGDYYGDAFDTTAVEELLARSIETNQAMLNDLDPTTQAYEELQKSIWEGEAALAVMRGEVETTNQYYEQHGIVIAGVTDGIEENTDAVNDNAGAIESWSEIFNKSINQMSSEYNQFEKDAETASKLIDEILFFNIDLDASDLDEQLEAAMASMYAYIGTLDPDSEAYRQAMETLQGLADKYYEIKYKTDDLAESTETAMRSAGEPSKFYEQAYKKLLGEIDKANDEINSLMTKKRIIEIKIDMATQKIEETEKLIEDLKLKKIEVEFYISQVNEEIDKLNDYIAKKQEQLEKIEIAIEITQAEIDKINEKIETLEVQKLEIQAQIDDAKINIQELNQFISDKELELHELKIQFMADVDSLNEQMATLGAEFDEKIKEYNLNKISISTEIENAEVSKSKLRDIIDLLGTDMDTLLSEGLDFYKVSTMLEDITGKSQTLEVQWESMLKTMFNEFSDFETDMKTASDAIDQLMYFDVDLDTTEVDEQINAAIFRMQDYLKTLSPESQAYKDASASLTQLTKKFEEMGGVLDEEKALQFNAEYAIQEVKNFDDQIDGLYTQLQENDLQFDIDQDTFATEMEALDQELANLYTEYNNKQIEIEADIQAAKEKVEAFEDQITALEDQKVAIETEIQEAKDQLDLYQSDLATLENQKVKITTDIAQAQTKIDELELELAGLEEEKMQIEADITEAEAQLEAFKQEMAKLEQDKLEIDAAIDTALERLTELETRLNDMETSKTVNIDLYVNNKSKDAQSKYHTGGLVTAHTGQLFPNERIAKVLSGEYVLRPAVAERFGADALNNFNASLNPNALVSDHSLSRQDARAIVQESRPVQVHIHEATRRTWAEVTDHSIYGNVKKRERFFESEGSPFN